MALSDDLSYRFRRPNAFHKVMQALVASRPGAWLFARMLPPVDSSVQRLTRGRHTVPSLLARLPVIDLTTTGRKSGQRRTTHLIALPHGDDMVVFGTNFGQAPTPAWVLNLEADPHASISYRNMTVAVVARSVSGAESTELLDQAAEIYVGYRKYQSRITGRRLRVFALESAER